MHLAWPDRTFGHGDAVLGACAKEELFRFCWWSLGEIVKFAMRDGIGWDVEGLTLGKREFEKYFGCRRMPRWLTLASRFCTSSDEIVSEVQSSTFALRLSLGKE